MSHSQTFSVILMHSHHRHAHALWGRLMHSHTLSCMSYSVNQPRMTTTPSLNMSDSQSSSVILMHSHTLSCMSYNVCQPRMTTTPPWIWAILSHPQSFSCILIPYHACRTMYVNLEWPTAHPWIWVIRMHSQVFSCIPIHYHACRTVYINLERHTPLLEYEPFSDILSHSHAFSSHTCSCIGRSYDAFSHNIMHVV